MRDLRVLAIIAKLPRIRFVPALLAGSAYLGRADRHQPRSGDHAAVAGAKMVEALGLAGQEKVLEVGTGYGYQTALLAMLAREVWSIELWQDMTDKARSTLATVGVENVTLLVGDGTPGLADKAPFDAIIVTAAFESVPPPLAGQLAAGGRLVQPIGPGGREDVRLFEKHGERLDVKRSITGAYFVRLYGEHAYPVEQAPAQPDLVSLRL